MRELKHGCLECKHSALMPRPGDKEFIRVCQRFPPQVVGFSTAQGGMVQTVFPQVDPKGICGEFAAEFKVIQ